MRDKKKIGALIVEDDSLVAELIQGLLEEAGYSVLGKAPDGLAAVRMATELEPDVILLDLQLPLLSGLEAADAINRVRPTPMVVLTAYDSPDHLEEATAAGVGAFLVKPPNPREMDRAIAVARARFADLAELRALNERLASEMEARARRDAAYATIIRTARDGFWMMDREGRCLEVNQAFADMLGYTQEEILALTVHDIEASETPEQTARHVEEVRKRGEARFETRHRRKDGTVLDVEISTNYLAGDDRLIVFARDITERKRAEALLRESEARLRAATDASLDSFFIFRSERDEAGEIRDFVFVDVNHRGEEALKIPREDLLGRRMCEVLPINREAGFFEKYRRVVETGIPLEEEFHLPDTHVPAAWYYHQVVPLGDGIAISNRNITDRRLAQEEKSKLEEQLRQAMKMEAVGRLAGGVAHDFNNLLTAINGYAELLLSRLAPADPMFAELKEIHRAGESAANLTRQLLAFSRKQIIETRVVDLGDLMQSLSRLLKRIIGEDVELVTKTANDPAWVRIDPSQFEQVVVNLAVNARDAMPDGGRLELETTIVMLGNDFSTRHPDVRPGEYVLLTVRDTGIGMTEEVIQNLFEPFFTTKPKGRGTGLGLATIYGTIKQLDGEVEVASRVGEGSAFHIYLPLAREPAAERIPVGLGADVPGGNETLLVVEDETVVRDLAVRILTRLGYNVLQAEDGNHALLLAEEYGEPIHLMITDVVMPGMNGRQLAERMKAIQPGMRVLFTSGYAEEAIAHRGVLEPGLVFIPKPYRVAALADKVREALAVRA